MKHKNLIQRLIMPLSELEVYYQERRKYLFEKGKKLKNIRLREALYPVFALFLSIDRRFRKQEVEVLGGPQKYDGPVIYACTHIGENDLENIYEVLQRGCWWFVGDPCVLYKNISGLFVYLNGTIMMETQDKTDRHIAYLRSVELLKAGGSLMIYPEGARNGTENLPVMALFPGAAKMAMETDTKIVPVGIEQYDRHFIIKFGTALLPENYHGPKDLTKDLRDALAALKWDIWESQGLHLRVQMPAGYREQFHREFETRINPYDTLETIEKARFHSREEIEQKEAFAHLEKLNPCPANAFLFRKKDFYRESAR